MQLTLRQQLTQFAHILQNHLFPAVEASLGELDDSARRLVAVLEMIPLSRFVPCARGWIGRPSKDRLAIASAFVAKAVYGFSLTRHLLQRLQQDRQLRRICGWEHAHQMPHESTFSRAFAEFAESELPQWVHAKLVEQTQQERLIGHISRDSTAVEARQRYAEKPAKPTAKTAAKPKGKRGPKPGKRGPHQRYKGGQRPYQPNSQSRLHRQRSMQLEPMLKDLPCQCSLGVKTSSDGNQKYWRGYKLHVDVADGQIPISAILTSASLHDSQAAIPLATLTSQRVTNLYDVMDTAYDATEILEHSRGLGHVPIVRPAKRGRQDVAPEKRAGRTFSWAEEDRFRERTTVERVFARLKDEFGAREIRVRGGKKVMAHLMFGVLALTADQILRLI